MAHLLQTVLLASWFISQAFRHAVSVVEVPTCVEFRQNKYGWKAQCESLNDLKDGREYVYNAGRGSGLARCGNAPCWCCNKTAGPVPSQHMGLNKLVEKTLNDIEIRIKTCATNTPWNVLSGAMKRTLKKAQMQKDASQMLGQFIGTQTKWYVQDQGLTISQGPLKLSGQASLAKALMLMDPSRYATLAADIFCNGKTVYEGKSFTTPVSLLSCRQVPFSELDEDADPASSMTPLDFMISTTLQGKGCQKLHKLASAKPRELVKTAKNLFPHSDIKGVSNGVMAITRMAAAKVNRLAKEHMNRVNWDAVVAALQVGGQAVLRVRRGGAALTKPGDTWILLTRILLPTNLNLEAEMPDRRCLEKLLERRPACVIWDTHYMEYEIFESCDNLRKVTDYAVLIQGQTPGPAAFLRGGGLLEEALIQIKSLHCIRSKKKPIAERFMQTGREKRQFHLPEETMPFPDLYHHQSFVPWVPMGSKQEKLATLIKQVQGFLAVLDLAEDVVVVVVELAALELGIQHLQLRVDAVHELELVGEAELDLGDTGRFQNSSTGVGIGVHFHLVLVDGGVHNDPGSTAKFSVGRNVHVDRVLVFS